MKRSHDVDLRFQVKKSTIRGAGNGLFARLAMSAGDRLQVVGVLVRRHSADDVGTRYADAYKFRVGDQVLIPFGLASYVNHSTHANFEKIIDGSTVHLQALRPIRSGEELFFTYSPYAQKRFLQQS